MYRWHTSIFPEGQDAARIVYDHSRLFELQQATLGINAEINYWFGSGSRMDWYPCPSFWALFFHLGCSWMFLDVLANLVTHLGYNSPIIRFYNSVWANCSVDYQLGYEQLAWPTAQVVHKHAGPPYRPIPLKAFPVNRLIDD